MPDEHVPSDEALREELVAYLDGELDGPASRAVEERLASEPRPPHPARSGADMESVGRLDAPRRTSNSRARRWKWRS